MLPTTTNNTLPAIQITDRRDWRMKVLLEYLASRGLEMLPGDPNQMTAYRAWLEQKGYANTTISILLSPVREAYRLVGIETRKIIRSPRRTFGFLKDPVPLGETKALLKYADAHCSLRDRLIVYLMAYLGLRDVEVSRMNVGYFYREDNKYWLRVWGKGRSGPDEKKRVANELLFLMFEYREKVLVGRKPEDPMFIGKKRARLLPCVVSRIVANIMKAAGVKREDNDHRITPHSLRHTAVTKVVKEHGVRKGQVFARHVDVRATELYAHDRDDYHPEVEISY